LLGEVLRYDLYYFLTKISGKRLRKFKGEKEEQGLRELIEGLRRPEEELGEKL